MAPNPDDMEQADDSAYWLELNEGSHTINEGETKDESETIHEGDEWFTGIVQEIDRNAGEYGNSRLYKLRTEAVDGAVLLWGKADLDRKVDNAALQTGDEIAIRRVGSQDVGEENEMFVYDVRYTKA